MPQIMTQRSEEGHSHKRNVSKGATHLSKPVQEAEDRAHDKRKNCIAKKLHELHCGIVRASLEPRMEARRFAIDCTSEQGECQQRAHQSKAKFDIHFSTALAS